MHGAKRVGKSDNISAALRVAKTKSSRKNQKRQALFSNELCAFVNR
jgi:hypothetical protein